jgi:beta-N-acetylhexosaminidase
MKVRLSFLVLFLFAHWSESGLLSGERKPLVLMKKVVYPVKVNYPIASLVGSYAEGDAPFADWESNTLCMAYVNRSMDSLSIEQKVAQCFMLACYTSGVSKNMDYVERMVQQGKCGGLLFFKGDPSAQAYWVDRLQRQSKTQLLVAIDGEWGISMRLDSTTIFPRQLTLGAITDNQWIYKMGQEIGRQCREVGVNVNFAPVSDVNNNPNNPVINDRSFGEDKMRVALKALEYGMGMQNEKVLACAKHFPGHGDTDKDSHYGIPVINKSLGQLDALELFPFKVLFTNGIGSTMSAHLSLPQLDKTGIPASLSTEITTNLLKNSLNFKGLVFTDALNMKGASTALSGRNVDSVAFVAGNDVLEYSENPERGIAQISKAIKSGDLPIEMLDEKVKKILALQILYWDWKNIMHFLPKI